MANLSTTSGLGFYTTSSDSLTATDLDQAPSIVESSTDTVYIERVEIRAELNDDGTQTYFCYMTFVATPSTDTAAVSKRWTETIETADLTEADFVDFMNDLQQFGQIDTSSRSIVYTDGSKTTSDFS